MVTRPRSWHQWIQVVFHGVHLGIQLPHKRYDESNVCTVNTNSHLTLCTSADGFWIKRAFFGTGCRCCPNGKHVLSKSLHVMNISDWNIQIQLTFNSPRAALASSFSIPAAGHNAETATNQVRCEAYRCQKSTFFMIVSNSFYHDSQIVVGSLVRVHSLLSNTNYNGATGVVIQLLPNRYRVNLSTGVNINVPFVNIVLIAPTNSTEVRVL